MARPSDTSGRFSNAPVSATARIQIAAPAEVVWRLLVEVRQWPSWHPDVAWVHADSPLDAGAMFTWRSKGFTVRSCVQSFREHQALSWTGEAFGTRAFHSWTLIPHADGVLLETAELFDGWLPRLMKRFLEPSLEDTLSGWLDRIKTQAEFLTLRDNLCRPARSAPSNAADASFAQRIGAQPLS